MKEHNKEPILYKKCTGCKHLENDTFNGDLHYQIWCGLDRCWYDESHGCDRWEETEWVQVGSIPHDNPGDVAKWLRDALVEGDFKIVISDQAFRRLKQFKK
jgi:hypothetical protein